VAAKIRTIGLTGGIACGKSTVARMLRGRGLPVLDADEIAREVVEAGTPALAEIRRAFGDGVIGGDGRLDRARLAEVVFADGRARRALEAITHPRLIEEARRRVADLGARGEPLAVWEAALLVETGGHRALDGLIVVVASPEAQVARLRARDGLGEERALGRLRAQMPSREKSALADYVIDNDGSIEDTARQVARVVADLHAGGPRQGGGGAG
jgi:dephospho-CoA kinase